MNTLLSHCVMHRDESIQPIKTRRPQSTPGRSLTTASQWPWLVRLIDSWHSSSMQHQADLFYNCVTARSRDALVARDFRLYDVIVNETLSDKSSLGAALCGAFVADRAGVQSRPHQPKPVLADCNPCSYTIALSSCLPLFKVSTCVIHVKFSVWFGNGNSDKRCNWSQVKRFPTERQQFTIISCEPVRLVSLLSVTSQ